MFQPNMLRRKLLAREKVLGTWSNTGSPVAVEIMAACGYDVVVIDQEHGLGDPTQLMHQLQAVDSARGHAMVRIPSNDPIYLKRVLDVGAQSIMIPNVESAEQARQAVAACRYPPRGFRGSAIGVARAARYGMYKPYRSEADDNILLVAQIESRTGVSAIAEIGAVEGIDVLFIGPFDLSGNLGHLGEIAHPDVAPVIAAAEKAILATGKAMGTVPHPGVDFLEMFAKGYHFVAAGSDISRLRDGSLADVAAFRKL